MIALFCHERPLLRHARPRRRSVAHRARRRPVDDRLLHHAVRHSRPPRPARRQAGIARPRAADAPATGTQSTCEIGLPGDQARSNQRLLARAAVDRNRRGARRGPGRGRSWSTARRRPACRSCRPWQRRRRCRAGPSPRVESRLSCVGSHYSLLGIIPTPGTSTSVPTDDRAVKRASTREIGTAMRPSLASVLIVGRSAVWMRAADRGCGHGTKRTTVRLAP